MEEISSVREHSNDCQTRPTSLDALVALYLYILIALLQLGPLFACAEQTHDEEEEEESKSSRRSSLSGVNSAAFARLTEKLRLLNLKYELISDQAELFLRCGDLLKVSRANDEACDLKDLPGIPEAWCCRDSTEVTFVFVFVRLIRLSL